MPYYEPRISGAKLVTEYIRGNTPVRSELVVEGRSGGTFTFLVARPVYRCDDGTIREGSDVPVPMYPQGQGSVIPVRPSLQNCRIVFVDLYNGVGDRVMSVQTSNYNVTRDYTCMEIRGSGSMGRSWFSYASDAGTIDHIPFVNVGSTSFEVCARGTRFDSLSAVVVGRDSYHMVLVSNHLGGPYIYKRSVSANLAVYAPLVEVSEPHPTASPQSLPSISKWAYDAGVSTSSIPLLNYAVAKSLSGTTRSSAHEVLRAFALTPDDVASTFMNIGSALIGFLGTEIVPGIGYTWGDLLLDVGLVVLDVAVGGLATPLLTARFGSAIARVATGLTKRAAARWLVKAGASIAGVLTIYSLDAARGGSGVDTVFDSAVFLSYALRGNVVGAVSTLSSAIATRALLSAIASTMVVPYRPDRQCSPDADDMCGPEIKPGAPPSEQPVADVARAMESTKRLSDRANRYVRLHSVAELCGTDRSLLSDVECRSLRSFVARNDGHEPVCKISRWSVTVDGRYMFEVVNNGTGPGECTVKIANNNVVIEEKTVKLDVGEKIVVTGSVGAIPKIVAVVTSKIGGVNVITDSVERDTSGEFVTRWLPLLGLVTIAVAVALTAGEEEEERKRKQTENPEI